MTSTKLESSSLSSLSHRREKSLFMLVQALPVHLIPVPRDGVLPILVCTSPSLVFHHIGMMRHCLLTARDLSGLLLLRPKHSCDIQMSRIRRFRIMRERPVMLPLSGMSSKWEAVGTISLPPKIRTHCCAQHQTTGERRHSDAGKAGKPSPSDCRPFFA